MLHIESYWKAHTHVIDEKGTACAIGETGIGEVHIVVPEDVDIPASINGRDLSQGKP